MFDHFRAMTVLWSIVGFMVGAFLGFYYLMYAASIPVGY